MSPELNQRAQDSGPHAIFILGRSPNTSSFRVKISYQLFIISFVSCLNALFHNICSGISGITECMEVYLNTKRTHSTLLFVQILSNMSEIFASFRVQYNGSEWVTVIDVDKPWTNRSLSDSPFSLCRLVSGWFIFNSTNEVSSACAAAACEECVKLLLLLMESTQGCSQSD